MVKKNVVVVVCKMEDEVVVRQPHFLCGCCVAAAMFFVKMCQFCELTKLSNSFVNLGQFCKFTKLSTRVV